MSMLGSSVRRGLLASAVAAVIVAHVAPSVSIAAKPESPASPAATQSASAKILDEATRKKIDDAIEDLGSTDFGTRSKAARTLWTIGDIARPALKEASVSDNPEV